jgi:hypothetical protein
MGKKYGAILILILSKQKRDHFQNKKRDYMLLVAAKGKS